MPAEEQERFQQRATANARKGRIMKSLSQEGLRDSSTFAGFIRP
jgi:hypothetical protein